MEHAYHAIVGAAPPEIFTTTVSCAMGRLRNVGIHLPTHATPAEVEKAISRHIGAVTEILARTSPADVIDDLLRRQRFHGGRHSEWRLPMALVHYRRRHEARQVLTALMAARVPHGRRAHELQWLGRRLNL